MKGTSMTNPKETYLRIASGLLAIAVMAVVAALILPGFEVLLFTVAGTTGVAAALSAIFSLTNPKG